MVEHVDVGAALDMVVAAIGGSTRPGQAEMAGAVWEALTAADPRPLLVQAGTGTGKSLAYGVPGAMVAVSNDTCVVIATATIALQRQLADQDLPRLAGALAESLGRTPKFEVLKGRGNYVCLDRLNRDIPGDDSDTVLFDSPTSRLGRQAARLRRWAEGTTTGDRDDIDFAVDGRVWSGVSVASRECPGAQSCRFGAECYAELARARCRSADIVVTNHAMLAVHLRGDVPVLPAHSAVIIDEAHELLDRVTSALTRELSAGIAQKAFSRAKGLLDRDLQSRATDVTGFLSDVMGDIPSGRLTRLPEELILALTSLRDVGHEALTALRPNSQDDADRATDRSRARAMVAEVHDSAAEILAPTEQAVIWGEAPTDRPAVLRVAPLQVTQLLSERLFEQARVVLTSATLSVGGDLGRTAALLGAPKRSRTLDVGSPFDYRRQAILYCPASLPRPARSGLSDEVLRELGDLIEAAGGRTLALFSSWRAVEQAAGYLGSRFATRNDLPLLQLGRGDAVATAVREFAEVPEATLLGTMSLWQGVDVPGSSCSLVVIDRIPFPRPDDPLISARQELIDKSGGSGFASISVPRAALLLAQGSGRLIRSTTDRGVVAVLDSRLATASYSPALIRSLPDFFLTTDGDAVRGALRRLRESAA